MTSVSSTSSSIVNYDPTKMCNLCKSFESSGNDLPNDVLPQPSTLQPLPKEIRDLIHHNVSPQLPTLQPSSETRELIHHNVSSQPSALQPLPKEIRELLCLLKSSGNDLPNNR